MSKRIQAKARVQITIEVDTDYWNDEATVSQVYKQAGDIGMQKLRDVLAESKYSFRIISQPRVVGVITEIEN